MLLQAWSGIKPSMNNLWIFRYAAYSHILKDGRGKLSPKVQKCFFLGYGDVTKGYKLFDPIKDRIIHSWHVVFDENNLGIEKEQENNFTQDISWSLDVSTKTRVIMRLRNKQGERGVYVSPQWSWEWHSVWWRVTSNILMFRTHSTTSRF